VCVSLHGRNLSFSGSFFFRSFLALSRIGYGSEIYPESMELGVDVALSGPMCSSDFVPAEH